VVDRLAPVPVPLLQGFDPTLLLVLSFDPTLLLVLNLAGTFVFGLSGGLAGVEKRLDMFGIIVLAVVVGLAGGITRDLLIGIPPQSFRDWRYLAVAGGAGLVTFLAHRALERRERPVLILDAAGLALFCVTGASTALDHHVGAVEAVVLGAITGIGGGVLRDILVREIPSSCAPASTRSRHSSAPRSSSALPRAAATTSPSRSSEPRSASASAWRASIST
jgi:glycine transporter